MMKMPGFNAEAALRASVGPFWSAKQVPGRTAGVVPAVPFCCSTCNTACLRGLNDPVCQACRVGGCRWEC